MPSPRFLAPVLWALAACTSPPPTTGTVSQEPFRSAVVNDDYVLRYRLPPGYDAEPTRRYPLVVQLDPTFVGLQEFAITSGLISQKAAAGTWEEAIVVGVDYPDPNTRLRDYALPDPLAPAYDGAGADRFYRALEEEILPHVAQRFRVDGARRYLVGHSNGGVFGWYAVFRHDPVKPPLFAGVVAADCGFDEELLTYEGWHASRSSTLPMRVYTSRAAFNGAIQQIGFGFLVDRLASRSYGGLQFAHEVLETDHGGAIWPSFEHGLEHMLGAHR
jgi:hypothetical protein